jgi:tripartite-type tricarboxylate transporter receptor subunit TctC
MMIAVTVEGRFATPVAKGATMRTSAATLALVAVTMAAAAYPVVSSAQTVEAFYKGKTIDLIVGGAAGGGYDIYGRAVARHWGKHIPGNPTFAVRNMPGAAGMAMLRHTASAAVRNGLVVGTTFPLAILKPLMEKRDDYLPTSFSYIGSANQETRVCLATKSQPVKTMDDALTREVVMGGNAPGGAPHDTPIMLNNILGTKFKLVAGYPGTQEIALAVERGEVGGICGFGWTSLMSQQPQWVTDNKINIMVQIAMEPYPALVKMGVPMIWNWVKTDEQKRVLEFLMAEQVYGRPFLGPPGIPADRLAALRDGFMATMRDPEFLADAEKTGIEVDPVSGEKFEAMIKRVAGSPPDIIEKAVNALKR